LVITLYTAFIVFCFVIICVFFQAKPLYCLLGELLMSEFEKQSHINRIYSSDARTVIAAMDHGLYGVSPLSHLTRPGELIDQVIRGGANAVLTSPGIVLKFNDHLVNTGIILRLDGGGTNLYEGLTKLRMISSVEDAVKMGADAVVAMGFCGTEDEYRSLATLGQIAIECRKLNMPLMAEMLPMGYDSKPSLKQILSAARIGADLGADIVKIRFSGSVEDYQAVTEACFVPVVILGGAANSQPQLLKEVRSAIQAGASGVAIGRNIWQSDSPALITRSIADIVHDKQ